VLAAKGPGQTDDGSACVLHAPSPDGPFHVEIDCAAAECHVRGFARPHLLVAYDGLTGSVLAAAITEGLPRRSDWLELLPQARPQAG